MTDKLTPEQLELIISRMVSSQDASDRVRAAGELGEVGTPEIAPKVLEVVWQDSQSNVREMAIQSFAEILGDDAAEDLGKVLKDHYDDNVRLYATHKLGTLSKQEAINHLKVGIHDKNEKIRAITIRELIHIEAKEMSEHLLNLLRNETYNLAKRNILEALALWRYKPAKQIIIELLKNENSLEVITFSHFALAIFGEKDSLKFLENEEIETMLRVSYKDKIYRGREGLIEIIKILK
jgi:HEAT repeat protein